MVGGEWDATNNKLRDLFEEISTDKYVVDITPRLAKCLHALGPILYTAIGALDSHVNGDCSIKDIREFEKNVINDIRESCKSYRMRTRC